MSTKSIDPTARLKAELSRSRLVPRNPQAALGWGSALACHIVIATMHFEDGNEVRVALWLVLSVVAALNLAAQWVLRP